MADTNLVLWKGGVQSLQQDLADSPIIQSRFFLPSEILISRYGIVAMLIVDSKPSYRWVSYYDTEWTGVYGGLTQEEFACTYGGDAVRRAHFVDTEQGFSIIRAFALPSQVADVFARDSYLGEPMIEKCACENTFEVEFDERQARTDFSPVMDALPLIESVAFAGWEAAHIPDVIASEWRQFRTWVSFHGWFAFADAVAQGQLALQRAIGNFDSFLQRVAPQVSPYSTDLVRTSGVAIEKS